MKLDTGLQQSDFETILSVLKNFPVVTEAYIFGSRAKGSFRKGSDVDIALKGNNIDFKIVSEISHLLNEETILPYKFDILNYHTINNADLIEHIDRVGVCIYKSL